MSAPQEPLGGSEPGTLGGDPQPGVVNAAIAVVYEDAAGEFRWKAMDTNNRTVADSGEGYESRSYAEKAVTDLFPFAILRVEVDED